MEEKDYNKVDEFVAENTQLEVKIRKQKIKIAVIIVAVLLVVLFGLTIYNIIKANNAEEEKIKQQQQIEILQLDNEQLRLAGEFREIDDQFKQYEGREGFVANDSILEKYAAAKNRIEQLINELNNEKSKNAERVRQLEAEIATLKDLLRHYLAQIGELQEENAGLQQENANLIATNTQLSSQIERVSQQNESRADSMRLAKKLNISNLAFTPLNKKDKREKKIKNAKKLDISFTIPQNHSTPVGEKTIYLRITSPEGALLGNMGTFVFEGETIPYTEKRVIEYAGEEMPEVHIYWAVTSTLSKGEYLVELFADGYRIASKKFMIEK